VREIKAIKTIHRKKMIAVTRNNNSIKIFTVEK